MKEFILSDLDRVLDVNYEVGPQGKGAVEDYALALLLSYYKPFVDSIESARAKFGLETLQKIESYNSESLFSEVAASLEDGRVSEFFDVSEEILNRFRLSSLWIQGIRYAILSGELLVAVHDQPLWFYTKEDSRKDAENGAFRASIVLNRHMSLNEFIRELKDSPKRYEAWSGEAPLKPINDKEAHSIYFGSLAYMARVSMGDDATWEDIRDRVQLTHRNKEFGSSDDFEPSHVSNYHQRFIDALTEVHSQLA